MSKKSHDTESEVLVREKSRVKTPKQYKVFLLNDDYTTMDFVVQILEGVFMMTPAESVQVMLHVHRQGRGLAGVFTKQIAEAKVDIVHSRAQAEGYPLRCVMEEA
jgi:ATP-dependent Clp protease adaptor protein ClpS